MLAELVRHGETGWLVEPDDARGLAQLLERCTAEVDQLPKIGAKAKAVVSRYTPDRVVSAFLEAAAMARAIGSRR